MSRLKWALLFQSANEATKIPLTLSTNSYIAFHLVRKVTEALLTSPTSSKRNIQSVVTHFCLLFIYILNLIDILLKVGTKTERIRRDYY